MAALEEATVCLGFGAILTVKSLNKIEKGLKLYGFRKAQEVCLNTDLMKIMNNQSELTVETPGSFIGLSMAEIRGVYVELNPSQTHIPRGAYVCTRKYLT